jgi:hypothetical protein
MPDQPRSHDPDSMRGDVERLLRQLRQLGPASPDPTPAPAPSPAGPARRSPLAGTSHVRRTSPAARAPQVNRGSPVVRTAPITLPSPLGVWARIALGAVLAGALTQWPYPFCGLDLAAYLAAAGTLAAAGAWAAHAAWRRRMPLAHTLAITLILTGATLTALQTVPRPGHPPTPAAWRCP